MAEKRKQYIYYENVPLTKYARTQFRKGIDNNGVELEEKPSVTIPEKKY